MVDAPEALVVGESVGSVHQSVPYIKSLGLGWLGHDRNHKQGEDGNEGGTDQYSHDCKAGARGSVGEWRRIQTILNHIAPHVALDLLRKCAKINLDILLAFSNIR